MANPLNRDLKNGDQLVLVDGRVVTCTGSGFGCKSFTIGRALMVTKDGYAFRIEGCDIDAEATTKQFSEQNGWSE
jgi:hypothetical protein